MVDSTLDTSGAVLIANPHPGSCDEAVAAIWSDLSPFAQGYVEALAGWCRDTRVAHSLRNFGFSDLSPEALALILRDCERFVELFGEWPLNGHGKHFWLGRQKRKHPDFPPLTVFLSDDGKVCLRVAA